MVAAPGLVQQLTERYLWSGVKILVMSLVVIVLAFGVIRPLLSQKSAAQDGSASGDDIFAVEGGGSPDPFVSLKDYTMGRQDDAAAILQEWLNEDRKAAVNE